MKTVTQINKSTIETTYKFLVGDHTVGDHTIKVYTDKNYINNLLKDIRTICKERNIKIKYYNTASDRKILNSQIESSNAFVTEFMNKIDSLDFVNKTHVTGKECGLFCTIANEYGRHGSKSYLKYSKLHEYIYTLETALEKVQDLDIDYKMIGL